MHRSLRKLQIPFIAFALFAIVFLIYKQTLFFAFVANDDAMLITNNPLILTNGWKSIVAMFHSYDPELYIPLTLLTYKVEYLLFGLNPLPFHATNILLHAINSFLVFFVVKNWSNKRSIACLCALLFAVHPLHAEVVSWITGRKDLLSSTFFLGALLSYQKEYKLKWTLILYSLSLFAKGNAITFPFVIALLEYQKEYKIDRNLLRKILPYLILSGIFLIIGMFGKLTYMSMLSLSLLPIISAKSILLHIRHTIFPTTLSNMLYPITQINIYNIDVWIPVFIVTIIAITLYVFRKKIPIIFFGFFFFIITLSPSFLVFEKRVPFYNITSNRYAYISILGLLYIICHLINKYWQSLQKIGHTIICILLSIGIVTLTRISKMESMEWRNNSTLILSSIEYIPDFGLYYFYMGEFLIEEKRTMEAIGWYREGIMREKSPKIRAVLHNALGKAYQKTGSFNAAQDEFITALSLIEDFEEAQQNLEEVQNR